MYMFIYMSRPARKPTLLTLRKVSIQISLRNPRMLTLTDSFDFLFQESFLYTSSILYMRGLHRMILVATLRRGYIVGFLAGRLIFATIMKINWPRMREQQWPRMRAMESKLGRYRT